MSEYKLKEIFAPQLNGQPYGQNLKEQFDAINSNFKLLANRDFVKGDKGNSIRAILDPIYDNELTQIGSQVVEALLEDALGSQAWASYKSGWDGISPKTIDNINNWTKNNNIVSLLPTEVDGKDVSFIDNAINLSLIRIQTFDPSETNPIYTDIAFANNFVLRDNRFVGTALSESDLAHYDEKIDVSGTVALTVISNNNYTTTVLHDFPTLYYKQNAFRWKIGGQETGIIAQGPSGANGKDGTIYMVKVSNNHPSDDDKKDWYQIDAVWDRIGSEWKPNSLDPKPITDYIKEGDVCVAFLEETTEESEITSSKIYITTVVSSNNILYAICDITQQIQFEAGLDIVEKFMNGLPYSSTQPTETDWIGLHVQDSQDNNDDQPFYQHMIHSESLVGNQEAGKLGDLIIEPINRKNGVGPAVDTTARLNFKYNKIRLGLDDVNDFGDDIRDSQIITNLYSTYTDGISNYWDRSRLTMSKESYLDDTATLKSITNISHDWNGEDIKQIDPSAEVSHVLNIGSEYLTISKDGNWDSAAALLCIYTASNAVSISTYDRFAWRNNSSSKSIHIPFNIGCSILNVTSENLTTNSSIMKAEMKDVYLGSNNRSNGYLTSCRLHTSSVYDSRSNLVSYVELIDSNFFIENNNEINSYNINTDSGEWSGDILLNFSPLPSNPDMQTSLIKRRINQTEYFSKYPGKVQIGSTARKSGLTVFGETHLGMKSSATSNTSQALNVYGKSSFNGDVSIGTSATPVMNISQNNVIRGTWATDIQPLVPNMSGSLSKNSVITLTYNQVFSNSIGNAGVPYVLCGKGLIFLRVNGGSSTSDVHEIFIEDIPARSFFHVGVKVQNVNGSYDANNVRFYLKDSAAIGVQKRDIIIDMKVKNNTIDTVEYAGFTTTGQLVGHQLATAGRTINK